MTLPEHWMDMRVLLVGADAALLEGLAQSFAAQGYQPRVVTNLHDARDSANAHAPLIAVIDQALAEESAADAAAIKLLPGGALMVFRTTGQERVAMPPTLQRLVLAELTLPLERNRLFALAQHVHDRVITTGRSTVRHTPPETRAI